MFQLRSFSIGDRLRSDLQKVWGVNIQIRRSDLYCFRYFGLETDPARVKEHSDKLSLKLDAYEAILKKQKYLGGDVSVSVHEIHDTAN